MTGYHPVLAPRLLSLLPIGDRLTFVDAGAGGGQAMHAFWGQLFEAAGRRLDYIGFEPNSEAVATVGRVVRAGLWSESGTRRMQLNAADGAVSFLPLNTRVTDRWRLVFADRPLSARDEMVPKGWTEAPVTRLDEWASANDVGKVDFIKLNIQGGELEALRGAGDLLGGVLGILTEVSFVESYIGRPLFADVDQFLRGNGFQFFYCSRNHVGRVASPVSINHVQAHDGLLGALADRIGYRGQMIEGDALYLRDVADHQDMTLPDRLKLAALAEIFGQVEYAFEVALSAMVDEPGFGVGPIIREAVDRLTWAPAAYDR